MDTASSDADLVVASLDDPARFADIFRRHYPAVYAYAVRAAGATAGEDIAAEVFVRAFAGRHRFDPAYKSARPWLFGIAANLVADHYRRGERHSRALQRMTPPGAESTGFDTDVVIRVAAEASIGSAEQLLGRLRREERDVVGLFALADLSYEDISRALGIPIGTVKSRLNRGRVALRNLIAPFGESMDDSDE
ncbi:MAG: RNA polymerase sigma factor [Acidimicrobiia bacterium]|nr:MAG: RNA polymerase sigma factor [Acidimicrobiia bacterium]